MDDNTNIDDLFRSELEPFLMEPSEKSWNSLQAELAKKRSASIRKRRLGWFSASVFLLILTYTSYKYFSSASSTDDKVKNNSEINIDDSNKDNSLINNPAPGNNSALPNTSEKQARKEPTVINSNSNIQTSSENQQTASVKLPTTESKTITNNSVPALSANKINIDRQYTVVKKTVNSQHVKINERILGSIEIVNKKPSNQNTVVKAAEKNNPSEVTTVPLKTNSQESINDTEKNYVTEKSESIATGISPFPEIFNTQVNTDEIKKESQTTSINSNSSLEPEQSTSSVNIPDQKANGKNVNDESKKIMQNEETPITALTQIRNSAKNQNGAPATEVVLPLDSEKSQASSNIAENPNISQKDSSISFLKKVISRLSADIYYSPDFVKTTLKPNDSYTGTASKNPADYAGQIANFSYSTGFHIGYDVVKKWSIRSGISFSTFSQSAVYNTLEVVADSVYKEVHSHEHGSSHGHHEEHHHEPPNQNNDHHYVIHTPCGAIDLHQEPSQFSLGGPQPVNGQSFSIKTETSETIHFIYIPLTVRYEFGKRKLSYFVEGGGAINLVKKDVVKVTVNDAYLEDNNFDGLNSFNYSLLFGAGVNYNFYKGLSTFLKPSLRYSVTPINQNNPLYSYPYYIGIGAGFSIHF